MVGLGPLHLLLMIEPTPTMFKRSRVDKNDGTTGPKDHVITFLHELQWYTFRDNILYRTFSGNLKETTYQWSVDLAHLFIAQHMEAIRIKKGNDLLFLEK